jgi:hypothetical protein
MIKSPLNFVGLAIMLCMALMILGKVPGQAQVVDGVPHLINYQGRLTDIDGNPVSDGEYLITFTIWNDSLSTAPADRRWISPDCPVLVINGLFNWQLGSRESLPPWIVANYTDLWLGIKVGDDPEMAPRTRLSSVPYAYMAWQSEYAAYADSAGMLAGDPPGSGWIDDGAVIRLETATDSVGIGVSSPAEKLDVDGTTRMTGFKMPTGAGDGHVLTSDASGKGSWQAPADATAVNARTFDDTTDASGNVDVTYPPGYFSSTPQLAVTVWFSGAGIAQMGYVTISNHTEDGFTLNVKDANGSNLSSHAIQISYVAAESN